MPELWSFYLLTEKGLKVEFIHESTAKLWSNFYYEFLICTLQHGIWQIMVLVFCFIFKSGCPTFYCSKFLSYEDSRELWNIFWVQFTTPTFVCVCFCYDSDWLAHEKPSLFWVKPLTFIKLPQLHFEKKKSEIFSNILNHSECRYRGDPSIEEWLTQGQWKIELCTLGWGFGKLQAYFVLFTIYSWEDAN